MCLYVWCVEVVVDRVYEARAGSGEWGVHRRAKALGWGQVLGPRLSIYRAHGSIEATIRNLIVGPASEVRTRQIDVRSRLMQLR
jgi:hypothetical protein